MGASRFGEAGLSYGHATDNALAEAAALVLHALHLSADLPDAYLDCRLTAAEREAVRILLERRIREWAPVAYLTYENDRKFNGGCLGSEMLEARVRRDRYGGSLG